MAALIATTRTRSSYLTAPSKRRPISHAPPTGEPILAGFQTVKVFGRPQMQLSGIPSVSLKVHRVLHCQHNIRAALMYSDSAREVLWVQVWRSHHDRRVEAQNTTLHVRWWNQGRKALNGCLRYDQARDAFVRLSAQELQPITGSKYKSVCNEHRAKTDAL